MKYPELPESIAHYKILSTLGRGGMGIVYLAEDGRLKRQVAIKCLYKQQQSEALVERLRREAKVLAKLNHPNVVHIYDVVDDEQGFALVMEYVKGRSLKHYLKENHLSQRQQLALLVQILDGLATAHSQGIIHRDLKLDNILIDEHGRAKIGDFGIAKRQSGDTVELTKHNNISGSLSAMSPEQIRGETLCPASDVFSFGLLAWQILRGQHPFEADSELVRVEKILNEPAPSLAGDDFPNGFTDCLDETLNKEPEKRPKDIAVLIKSLKSYAAELSEEIEDPTLTLRRSFLQPGSSNQAWVYLATILLALLLVVVSAREAYLWLQPEPDSVYVAILPPQLDAKDTLDYEDIQKTVYFALQDGVIALQNSFLIPASEVEGFEGSNEILAKAIGADVVIGSQLVCENLVCDLRLKSVLGNKNLEVSVEVDDKLLESHQLSQHGLADLFPDRRGLVKLSDLVGEEDYKEYLRLDARAKESENNYLAVINSLEILQERAPKFEPIYFLHAQLALDLYVEKRMQVFADRAENLLNEARQKIPSSTLIMRLLAELYSETDRPELSEKMISEFKKAGGNLREIEVLKGLQRESEKNYSQAIDHFSRANEYRTSVRTLRDLGINYWYAGNAEKAIEYMREAREVDPENIHAGLTLATFLVAAGELDEAEKLFLRFVELSNVGSTHSNLGVLYLFKRDYEKAIYYFEKARSLTNDQISNRLNLADTYMSMGESSKALKLYNEVVDSVSDEARFKDLIFKAQALIHLGEIKRALKLLSKLKSTSHSVETSYAEALLNVKLKDYPSTIIAIEKSLEGGLGKVWFTLPWFDSLCSDPVYGSEYASLIEVKCEG
ncbi:serine/threonine-protein kinase [Pseudoteredinibacter isoporae]|uniref:Serine/threonine-protein kinase n=1 Tax=Pseudoteredinibacter isoporae TaxID=570281 RepID=A0A7X0JRH6_9GAMM|nr:serine/threonine-protein kinase [Pseudoteredinibacter isoporae]MBB6520313.1 serine/threonine-protein kinase [Pseudoteredinibacter isoporae]NHO85884.1 protein kinase [Pseudoteredinibacter isoporae]NIB25664.1 protein kinase [Pseudoteredinibacter isoporae]